MQELKRVLNMPRYGLICLNRRWIWLDMFEFKTRDRVLNMEYGRVLDISNQGSLNNRLNLLGLINYIEQGHFGS